MSDFCEQQKILDEMMGDVENCRLVEKKSAAQKNKKGPGRPRKEENEKTKYSGVWLTKESRDHLDLLPIKGGLALKIKFLLRAFQRSKEKEEQVIRHIKKLIRSFQEYENLKREDEFQKKATLIAKEVDYLKGLQVIDDIFIMKKITKKDFFVYERILNIEI